MENAALAHAGEAMAHGGLDLLPVVIVLAASVFAVPLFDRLGLGTVLGYLAAGLLLGPSGIGLIAHPENVLHLAELGVVMFLFIIGLEMQPQRLWSLRRQIFGLGVIQVGLCGMLLTGVAMLLGFSAPIAFVFGMGFVLTSTAIVMQILSERNELATEPGRRMISILLLEDLAIVPLLALVAIISPVVDDQGWAARLGSLALAVGGLALLIFLGRNIMNPVFALLARAKIREVMTGAALLVVLGAAWLLEAVGLSMAMGAFLAGVLLSTSRFRHQLEADIDPFRGMLLGLFFLAVGMSLDIALIVENFGIVASAVVAFMIVKAGAIFAIARVLGAGRREAVERAVLMGQGGEFAFVLYTHAANNGLIDAPTNAIFTATVVLSMVLTPFAIIAMRRFMPAPVVRHDGVAEVANLSERILVVGFGRFGQITAQTLIGQGHAIAIIDNDVEMIEAASTFGFEVHYGDGTRLDILRAAGAPNADLVLVCTDRRETTTLIATLITEAFPLVQVMARAFDREHAIELRRLGIAFEQRETFESAMAFGAQAIRLLGATETEIEDVVGAVRERDRLRFEAQVSGGIDAGRDLLLANASEQAREVGVKTARKSALRR